MRRNQVPEEGYEGPGDPHRGYGRGHGSRSGVRPLMGGNAVRGPASNLSRKGQVPSRLGAVTWALLAQEGGS